MGVGDHTMKLPSTMSIWDLGVYHQRIRSTLKYRTFVENREVWTVTDTRKRFLPYYICTIRTQSEELIQFLCPSILFHIFLGSSVNNFYNNKFRELRSNTTTHYPTSDLPFRVTWQKIKPLLLRSESQY